MRGHPRGRLGVNTALVLAVCFYFIFFNNGREQVFTINHIVIRTMSSIGVIFASYTF